MAVIVIYDPADPRVANAVSQFLPSAHAPNFDSEPNKATNPDLSLLWTSPSGPFIVPQKYWKWGGGNTIVEMNQTEKNAVDQLEPEVLKLNEGVDADSGPTGPVDARIEVERGSAANASLKWDQTLGTWVIGTFGQEIEVADIDQVNAVVGNSSIADLSDVRSPISPSDGQVLTWNNGNGEWENADVPMSVNVAEDGSNLGQFNSLNFIGPAFTASDGGGGEADIVFNESSISITESQISDLQTYALAANVVDLTTGQDVSGVKTFKDTITSLPTTSSDDNLSFEKTTSTTSWTINAGRSGFFDNWILFKNSADVANYTFAITDQGVFRGRDGSAGAPTYSFDSASNYGMSYDPGANESLVFSTEGFARLRIEDDGTLNVGGTSSYETLVTTDDDIPNKKYVDDEIAANAGGATELDDLSDVDTTTTPPSTGDLLEYDGANWVPTARIRPTFVIFAEENGQISVGSNNYEFSFGNGAVNSGFADVPGIPVAFPCTLIALGYSSRQNGTTTATASISVTRNGTTVATSGIGSGSGTNTKSQIVTQVTPDTVNFVAGDTVQFLTASVSGTHDDVRVFAWFERTA